MALVETSEIVRKRALVLAAAAGIGIAVWRAIAADRQSKAATGQFQQAQREHVTTMFLDAVSQLDNDKGHMRLGAVLMLREITELYPELSRPTVDLLAAYLREIDYGDADPPPEVVAITRILIERGEE